MKYVTTKVKKNCPDKEENFNSFLNNKEVGLFINERFIINNNLLIINRIINLTPKLVPILHS